mmetsp:Transcript_38177/g.53002  ORF Transcript_38177/g.53002 Transcript_38177/m.53002 type:complete len:197 (+) Transcript_38177:87-677(+)|eukprot:CAMPEP_0196570732 /NCGR_PEP_ID=MMETSP1081-20130531/891_1 /TAXON_ID=36882 /ORGANISM="Pyramimonas amylifera, Strain CCMP720" /LENGTH=196 /DNA_ID=CAMNT_0041887341 /DNA_START=47 /DNA_END=637 /DNA_ORIENTATION=-
MFNLEPILFFGAGALLILGPKDVPLVAKTLGFASGRAAGFIFQAKAKFQKVTEQTEIQQLHAEVQETLNELHTIRAEVRGGLPFLATRAMQAAVRPGASLAPEKQHDPGELKSTPTFSSNPQMSEPTSKPMQQPIRPPSTGGDNLNFAPLPVSAQRLGLIPKRTDCVPSGADFISDSILERKVGKDLQKMLDNPET